MFAGTAALCFHVDTASPRVRHAWQVMGAGMLLGPATTLGLGTTLDPVIAPGVASVGTEVLGPAWYTCTYVALVLLLRARALRLSPSVCLDGLIAALGAAALVRAVAPVSATDLARAVADVLLVLVLGVGCTALGVRLDRSLLLLLLGLSTITLDDVVSLLWPSGPHGTTGIGSIGGIALLGLAADPVADAPIRPGGLPRRREVALPSGAVCVSLGLLAYGEVRLLPRLAGELAITCVAVAMVRALLTFREIRDLANGLWRARTDELTGLANRRYFLERAHRLMDERLPGEGVAVLLVDLDRFKDINDALGHNVGDDLLRLLGPRLRQALTGRDLLARLGGDEFAVLLRPADRERARSVAEQLRALLVAPFHVDDIALHIDASVGTVLCPDHGTDVQGLLRSADVAMYQAKASGGGVAIYVPENDPNNRRRLETIERLREAIENCELILHYQPKIHLVSGTVVGVEALARWNHPDEGLLQPDAFIPLAEHAGLMRSLTNTVLDLALGQCVAWWQDAPGVPVAVNLSASNLLDLQLPHQVTDALKRHHLPPAALELEITETTLMTDPVRARAVVEQLRALGIAIAVDDYGTGYSSLAYLRHLPLDELKLDRVFVADLGRDRDSAAIVRHTVDLAHSLGLRMVAEGVDSELAAQLLRGFGCDVAQGFHLAPPMPAEDLRLWLLTRLRLPNPRR